MADLKPTRLFFLALLPTLALAVAQEISVQHLAAKPAKTQTVPIPISFGGTSKATRTKIFQQVAHRNPPASNDADIVLSVRHPYTQDAYINFVNGNTDAAQNAFSMAN